MKFIKAQRIRWLGHVENMEVGAMTRKMMEGKLFIGRRKGRPRLRWMDDVVADLKVMKIKHSATDVHSVLRITQRSTECTSVAGHSSQHNITQHGMLPQHPTCTTKLICDYF